MTLISPTSAPKRFLAALLPGLLAVVVLVPAAPSRAENAKDSYKAGIKAMESGDWDWAVVYLQKATELKPDNVEYRTRLGVAKQRASFQHFEVAKRHLASGNLDEAIGELQQTVALNPSHQYAYVELETANPKGWWQGLPPAWVR